MKRSKSKLIAILLTTVFGQKLSAQVSLNKQIDSSAITPNQANGSLGMYLKNDSAAQNFASISIQWDHFIVPTLTFELNPEADSNEVAQTSLGVGPQFQANEQVSFGLGVRFLNESDLSADTERQAIEPNATLNGNFQTTIQRFSAGLTANHELVTPVELRRKARVGAAILAPPAIEAFTEAFVWVSPASISGLQAGTILNHDFASSSIEIGPAVQYGFDSAVTIAADYLHIREIGESAATRASVSMSYQP